MISGFNPFTLAPFGDDNEEDEDEESEEEEVDEQQVDNSKQQNVSDIEEKPK